MRVALLATMMILAAGVAATAQADGIDRGTFARALSAQLRQNGIDLAGRTDSCENPSFNCKLTAAPDGIDVWFEPTRQNYLARVRAVFTGEQSAQMAMEICSAAAEIWPAKRHAPRGSFSKPFQAAARVGNWIGTIAGQKAKVVVVTSIGSGVCEIGG